MTPYGSGAPLVVDSSAWFRQAKPHVQARWEATLQAGLLASCPVAALEIVTGAPNEKGVSELDAARSALPQAPVTASAGATAMSASRVLRGSRRLPATD